MKLSCLSIVIAAFAIIPFVDAQTSANSSPATGAIGQAQQQSSLPNSQGGSSKETSEAHEKFMLYLRFESFAALIANEELNAKRDIEQGNSPVRMISDYTKIIGLHGNEERIMRIILFDASMRHSDEGRRFYEETGTGTRLNRKEILARMDLQIRNQRKIIEEAILRLKQQFGEEDFKKLDAYVYRQSPEGIMAAHHQVPAGTGHQEPTPSAGAALQ